MQWSGQESAPGPDGLPYSVYRCKGGIGFHLLFPACMQLLDRSFASASGGTRIPASTRLNDSSQPGKWQTTFSSCDIGPWPMLLYTSEFCDYPHRLCVYLPKGESRLDITCSWKNASSRVTSVVSPKDLQWEHHCGWGRRSGTRSISCGLARECVKDAFLCTIAFETIFRWLHDAIITRSRSLPACLQPTVIAPASALLIWSRTWTSNGR